MTSPIAPNASLPDLSVKIKTEGGIEDLSLNAWGAGRRVVLFAVPGAFTPTCSAQHLPDFVASLDALRAKGIEAVGCLAVNDVFVMSAWGEANKASGITMMADPSGAVAQALGILKVNTESLGNTRATRMALIAEDSIVRHVFIEEPGAYDVSSPSHIMKSI